MSRRWSLPVRWLAGPATLAAIVSTGLVIADGLGGTPARAAVIETEHRTVTIRRDGTVREEHRRVVRLESASDVDAWRVVPIYLDLNRRLDGFTGRVVGTDGKARKVKRKHQDNAQVSDYGELHASRSFHLVEPEGLRQGDRLELSWSLEIEPYFPADAVHLERDDEVRDFRLTIRVEPGVEGWRWRLDGPQAEGFGMERLTFEDSPGGVTVSGALPKSTTSAALASGPQAPVVRYGWGGGDTWRHVGLWYEGLLRSVPRRDAAVATLARRLTEDAEDDRARLESLLRYVQDRVRYVAVQIGIGGYVPTPPAETMARGWGDCKDKALLLVELLQHLGIEAFPALVRLDASKSFDADFPSAGQFNHLIVAVPASAVATSAEDPVAGGYLFVDATQNRGSARYLNSYAGGQQALVVTPGGGSLVRTPVRVESERSSLTGSFRVDASGSAEAQLVLEYTGDVADRLLRLQESIDGSEMETRLHGVWRALAPQAKFSDITWTGNAEHVPVFRLEAAAHFGAWLSGGGKTYSLMPPAFRQLPEVRDLAAVPEALAFDVSAGRADSRFEFALPPGVCPVLAKDEAVDNAVGSFTQRIRSSGDATSGVTATVERAAIVREPWVAPEARQNLLDLATAESQAARRKVRFHCD